jgi:hypothetical protein
MDRERLRKLVTNILLLGLFLVWILGAFTWIRNAPDTIKPLWLGGFFIIFILARPIRAVAFWVARYPNPVQAERDDWARLKIKTEDDPFGG